MAWLEQRELGEAEDEFREGLGQTSKKLMTLALFLCDMGRMEGVEPRKHDLLYKEISSPGGLLKGENKTLNKG